MQQTIIGRNGLATRPLLLATAFLLLALVCVAPEKVDAIAINIWKHRYPFYGGYPYYGYGGYGGYGGGYGGISIGGYGYGRR